MTMTLAQAAAHDAVAMAAPRYDAVLYGELTADGRDIALVAQGSDWGVSQIAGKLARMTPLLREARIGGNKTGAVYCPATWPAVVQLGFTFSRLADLGWVPGPRLIDWITEETVRRTSPPPEPAAGWPAWLQLRPYQVLGAAEIASAGRFLLLDDPGTGKTITAICGADSRRLAGHEIFPVLIVVPSWEVADGWAREIVKWAPGWGEPVMHGGPGREHKLSGAGVAITTYATLRRDAADAKGPLPRWRPATVIADEIHLIKNPDAQQSRALIRVARHADTIVGASGTPVTRNTGDVHPLLKAMDERSWPDRERMTERYCEKVPDDYGPGKILGLNPLAAEEFFACLLRAMRRVAKADVLDQLPPKTYSVRRPEIPPEWRHAYATMERDMLAELPDGGELPVMSTLAKLTRLAQLASSAADVTVTEETDARTGLLVKKYHVRLKAPSWKAESLLAVKAERPDMPVAAFTVSRQLAMITGQYCEAAGLRTGYIVGNGDGITRTTRRRAVEDFQAGKLDMIICTAGAGGLGITLTASNTAVMLQRPYPLDQAIQPEDRVHRIGAEIHGKIEIIDIVARGTVDERVRALMREKAGQWSEFVRDPRIVRELLGGIQ
jgi:SNF2 family DNA or RNA helicase